MSNFLPITRQEALDRGWEELDFVCVTGDAYVDHPSFGMAIVSRLLESLGYRVGIIPQPQNDGDFTRFGRPKVAFFINSGVIDSMVAHYTAAKRRRSDDAYTPGNRAGKRPDRAVTVYCKALRRLYPDTVQVIGGLEASLRRFAHYDYWDDEVRPSILVDCGADLLIHGMGERQTVAIAQGLAQGKSPQELRHLRGICYLTDPLHLPDQAVTTASFHSSLRNRTPSMARQWCRSRRTPSIWSRHRRSRS